ncbi:MAG TPA: hypothetical protein VK283_11120 [Acidimicrobiales bacterium]|nr:hypothetical protein [Acidimicrobiales bacterium]
MTFLVGGLSRVLSGGGGQLGGAASPVPTGVLYTSLLMLHVLCAVVGFGTMVVTGVQAARARRAPSASGFEGVRRYFRPGVNWAGRTLYGVPVFGFSLIGASHGAFRAGDGFVVSGLVLWLAATLVAEAVVWPGERRIQLGLAARWGDATAAGADAGAAGAAGAEAGADAGAAGALDRECRRVAASATLLVVLFLAATVIMVGKP